MTDSTRPISDAYSQQLSILEQCYHPSGAFIRFEKEEIEQSIPSRFEQQVHSYPQRLAIKTQRQELTYNELNKLANRVAHMVLEQLGAGDEPVALLFEQGDQAITAILGVLKAGKFFVSLDTGFPNSRISYMLEELQTRLILTDSLNFSKAKALAPNGCQLINVDTVGGFRSTENLGLPIPPDSNAYILYTSGSTGEPKGVVQNHRNVLNAIMIFTNRLHICEEDRLPILASFSVSMAITNTFTALLNGAALFPMNIQGERLPNLASWLAGEEITTFRSVPSVFRQFARTLTGEEKFPKLRLIAVVGEPLLKTDVELYKSRFSQDCIFVNVLGSTESLNFRIYLVDHQTHIAGSTVAVGYPVEDMEVLLLDDAGEEVGVSQTGEIAVRSRYLSSGYWRRPDLTRAAFLGDPGGDERIYLTGDLGRMLPDGCLEHLGRKDFQVKVRGYRVELAEIETALLSVDNIKDAVVVAREDSSGGQRLVAYVVPAGQPPSTASDLRGRLEDELPDFMVPAAFVFLQALPLLPSGKIDQLALPQPGPERPNLDSLFVAPRTPVEEALVKIWSEVLGLDRIGIDDNFLELGGDSLLASLVISRVISTFKVELPLRSLFEAPTVAAMALVIVQSLAQEADQDEIERMLAEVETISAEQGKQAYSDHGT